MSGDVIEVTAQAVKPQTKEQYIQEFSDSISNEIAIQKGTIETIIKRKNLEIDDFKRLLIEISSTNGLMDCTPKSIVSSAISLLELNLSLSKMIGQAYVLPFKTKGVSIATPIIGAMGWKTLAYRAGCEVDVTPIYVGDEYSLGREKGDIGNKITYNKKFLNDDGTLYLKDEYNPSIDKNGLMWSEKNLMGINVELMRDGINKHYFVSHSELRLIMMGSPSKNNADSPYKKWYTKMMMAKAVKSVLSKMPFTDEQLLKAIEIDIKSDIIAVEN